MKRINRFIAAIMAVVLVIGGLTACGKKDTSDDTQSVSSNQENKKDNSDSKNEGKAKSSNTSSDNLGVNGTETSDTGSNVGSAASDNPLAKQLQFVILSDSKVKVTLTNEYLSQLECRDNGDGSQTSLNALYISGYDSDYNQIFYLDFTKWGWNFGAGENFWADGDMNLENDTATFEISLLNVGTVMRKVSRINMMYNDWHDNPDEPKVLMNEDYSAEGVISEQLRATILNVSFPQDNRVKFTLAKTAEIEASMDPSAYGSISIGLYPDVVAMNGHREAVSINMNCSEYDGRTDYYASLGAQKFNRIDEWNYESEWVDLDEFGLRVNPIIKDDSIAIAATMEDIQSLISACSVYQVRDSYYNTIEIGYLKDVFRNESYGSFPAEFADASDTEFRFVPHSDSYRLISFETDVKIPNMKWYQDWGIYCYGSLDDSDMRTGKARIVVFWNDDETGYSNMLCKIIFENEQDRKDFMVGSYKWIVSGASEEDDSLITAEAYAEAMKDSYFEGCSVIGGSGNIAYFEENDHYQTELIYSEEDYYSYPMEIYGLDLWHDVEYKKDQSVVQNASLKIHDRASYEEIVTNVTLTSYSTY